MGFAVLVGTRIGETAIPVQMVLRTLGTELFSTGYAVDRIDGGIVWNDRLTWSIVAACCGAGLADPYLLAISAAASAGAVLVAVARVGAGAVSLSSGALAGSPVAAGATLVALWNARALDAFTFGAESAASLGVPVRRMQALLIVVATAATATMISIVGAIGFVELVVPHAARFTVGARHDRLLPAAALLGAVFMIAADVVSRILLPDQVLPIGVVTALPGRPAAAPPRAALPSPPGSSTARCRWVWCRPGQRGWKTASWSSPYLRIRFMPLLRAPIADLGTRISPDIEAMA